MSSLRQQDRKSLCRFTFADGRQCRTPRSPGHPHLCSDHARKDSQARAADQLADDFSYFFSGEYLSACDLTAALGRLIAGVARGDIKPRSARTLAYLSQTLLQTIRLAQDEYINAFDTDGWRSAVRHSVNHNFDYRNPTPPPEPPPEHALHVEAGLQPGQGQPPNVVAGLQTGAVPSPQPARAPQPAPPLHIPLPPTSAEFAQHLLAGRNLSRAQSRETGRAQTPQPSPPPQLVGPPSNRHSEQSEEPAFSELRPALSRTAPTPQPALYGRGDP